MTTKRSTEGLAGTTGRALGMTLDSVEGHEEKGRASEGAAVGAEGGQNRAERSPSRFSPGDGHRVQTRLGERGPVGPKPGENWKPIGAVAADILARCHRARYQMTCAN